MKEIQRNKPNQNKGRKIKGLQVLRKYNFDELIFFCTEHTIFLNQKNETNEEKEVSDLCSSKDILQLQHKRYSKKNRKGDRPRKAIALYLNLNFGLFKGTIQKFR